MVYWEGMPTGFGMSSELAFVMPTSWFLVSALHEPYVLAFEPSFVEIRHIETGLLSQVIQGSNLRLLFADTPPSVTNSSSANQYNPYQQHGSVFHFLG